MTNSLYIGGFQLSTVRGTFTPTYAGGATLRRTDGRHSVGTMMPSVMTGFASDLAPFDDTYYSQMVAMFEQQAVFPAVLPNGETLALRKNAITRQGYLELEGGQISATFDVSRRTIFADMGASITADEMGRFSYPLGIDPSLAYSPKAWEWNEAAVLVPGSAWGLRELAAGHDIAPYNNARPKNSVIGSGLLYPQRLAVIDITPDSIDHSSGTSFSYKIGMMNPAINLLAPPGGSGVYFGGFGAQISPTLITTNDEQGHPATNAFLTTFGKRFRIIMWAIPGGKARIEVWNGNTLINRKTNLSIISLSTGYIPFIQVIRGIAKIHCIWIDEV
jgi:hypothetical protein